MQIKFLGHKLVLTPAIKVYIETKMKSLENFLTRYETDREVIARFELARETHHHKGQVFYAEVTLHLPGRDIRAEARETDARVAVDSVKNKLKVELVRYKEKMLGKRNK